MEQALGADFGNVRIHSCAQSNQLNRSLQARAFTTGRDIFIRQGEYRSTSDAGRRLLAHELAHVMQQRHRGVQFVQRFTDPDTGDKVDPKSLTIDELNTYLGRSDLKISIRNELRKERDRQLNIATPRTRQTSRRITTEQQLKEQQKSAIKQKSRKRSKAEQEKLKTARTQEVREQLESERRVTRSKTESALNTVELEFASSTDIVGYHYTGSEVNRGSSYSGIIQTIKDKIDADVKGARAVQKYPQYIQERAEQIVGSSKSIDYIADTSGRTRLIWGHITNAASSFEVENKQSPTTPLSGAISIYEDRGHLVPEAGLTIRESANIQPNIIAENAIINQKYKKAFEDKAIELAKDNPDSEVWTLHEPLYKDKDLRPYQVRHYIALDGVVISAFTFDNPQQILGQSPRV